MIYPKIAIVVSVASSLVFSGLLISSHAQARQYVPADGKVVVEHLKKDALQRQLQTMRQELNAQPQNVSLAAKLARAYIAQTRNTGDPRYLGYAQAALSPWWKEVQAPSEILVLRATILQSTHQFSAALNDLDLVLKLDREDPQAWLTRATILQVLGRYDEAKLSCARLQNVAPEIITSTCLNQVASLNGEAEKSYHALVATLKKTSKIDAGIKIWVLTLLAEIAQRRGDAVAAQTWFGQAMQTDTPDSYLLGAYADFLLDQGRFPEVLNLLKDKTRNDSLLLRYAIALQKQNAPNAAEQIGVLEQRFKAASMREDTVHQREHARFELQLKNNSAAALVLAQKNWAVQKEPADLRIYLEAALANKNPLAAAPALEWMKKSKLEDKVIQKLALKLNGVL
ncbi:tetratricopeptide repeat protein [Undibacterium sp.]|uniref:tetratricopeptide repeat protein n=1 Tax=Undibacterium sp. TaxID=1914977 RepID=UPI003753B5C5